MQPMVNMALRAIRTTVDEIKMIVDREELSFNRPETIDRVINKVNVTFYEHVTKALKRAYPKSYVADYGDLRGKADNHSWHVLPLHNQTSFIHGLPDWCFSVVCKKNDQTEHSLVIFPATNEEYTASRGSGASLKGVCGFQVTTIWHWRCSRPTFSRRYRNLPALTKFWTCTDSLMQ